MQDIQSAHSQPRMLTDAELDHISGGSIFGRIVHFLGKIFGGPGDHRRPLDRP